MPIDQKLLNAWYAATGNQITPDGLTTALQNDWPGLATSMRDYFKQEEKQSTLKKVGSLMKQPGFWDMIVQIGGAISPQGSPGARLAPVMSGMIQNREFARALPQALATAGETTMKPGTWWSSLGLPEQRALGVMGREAAEQPYRMEAFERERRMGPGRERGQALDVARAEDEAAYRVASGTPEERARLDREAKGVAYLTALRNLDEARAKGSPEEIARREREAEDRRNALMLIGPPGPREQLVPQPGGGFRLEPVPSTIPPEVKPPQQRTAYDLKTGEPFTETFNPVTRQWEQDYGAPLLEKPTRPGPFPTASERMAEEQVMVAWAPYAEEVLRSSGRYDAAAIKNMLVPDPMLGKPQALTYSFFYALLPPIHRRLMDVQRRYISEMVNRNVSPSAALAEAKKWIEALRSRGPEDQNNLISRIESQLDAMGVPPMGISTGEVAPAGGGRLIYGMSPEGKVGWFTEEEIREMER